MATLKSVTVNSEWVELFDASGIASLTSLLASNDGVHTFYIATTDDASEPAPDVNGVAVFPLEQYTIDADAVGVWARAKHNKGTVITVQDNSGNAIRKRPVEAVLPADVAVIGDSVDAVIEVSAKSFAVQNPVGIGVANIMPISFGAAQPPELDANGKYTAGVDGQVTLAVEVSMQRGGVGGEAHLWIIARLNGTPTGSQKFILDNNRERIVNNFTVIENLMIGDTVEFFLYRQDDGGTMQNDGGLYPAANPDGLPDAPSAFLEVTKSVIV